MAKYISVEIAKKALADSNLIPRYAENCKPITDRIIDSLTAADVEPVRHGRWISKNTHGYDWTFVCSNCGYIDGHPFNDRHNFCPHCGAKMDGGV